MAGEVKFRADQADWIAANRLWHRSTARRGWLIAAGLLMLGLAAATVVIEVALSHRRPVDVVLDIGPLWAGGLAALLLPSASALALPRQVRRMFAQRRSMADETTCRERQAPYFSSEVR